MAPLLLGLGRTLLIVLLGLTPAAAVDYRKAGEVPSSWQQFSQLLKIRLEEWVKAETPTAQRFRDWGRASKGQPGGPPDSVVVRVWANPDGSISRVAFPSFDNAQADADFRALLLSGNLGQAPPPDMLQPVNLRIVLAFRE
jgi:hypothetical protein